MQPTSCSDSTCRAVTLSVYIIFLSFSISNGFRSTFDASSFLNCLSRHKDRLKEVAEKEARNSKGNGKGKGKDKIIIEVESSDSDSDSMIFEESFNGGLYGEIEGVEFGDMSSVPNPIEAQYDYIKF
jgi:hypothetical protein